jgi:hypothetical protein
MAFDQHIFFLTARVLTSKPLRVVIDAWKEAMQIDSNLGISKSPRRDCFHFQLGIS